MAEAAAMLNEGFTRVNEASKAREVKHVEDAPKHSEAVGEASRLSRLLTQSVGTVGYSMSQMTGSSALPEEFLATSVTKSGILPENAVAAEMSKKSQ